MLVLPDFECALCGEEHPGSDMEFAPTDLNQWEVVCVACTAETKAAIESALEDCRHAD